MKKFESIKSRHKKMQDQGKFFSKFTMITEKLEKQRVFNIAVIPKMHPIIVPAKLCLLSTRVYFLSFSSLA
jgi:hypothetical protein